MGNSWVSSFDHNKSLRFLFFYFKQNLNTYLMVSAGHLMVGAGILTTSMTVTLSAGHQRNNEQKTRQHITFGDVSGVGNGCSPGPRSPPLCLMTNKHTFGSILCTAKTFQFEAIVCKFRKETSTHTSWSVLASLWLGPAS